MNTAFKNQFCRLAITAGLAAFAPSVPYAMAYTHPVSMDDSWRFTVTLDDKPIGHHEFVVRRTESGERVEINADFDVRILRIPVYSYRHTNTETWSDGCLRRLDSRTDDNGTQSSVSARDEGEVVVIETSDDVRSVDANCVSSFAYWNRGIVDNTMLLNAQTGELVEVAIERIDTELPQQQIEFNRLDVYRISSIDGAVNIKVAYEADSGRWVYLESRLESGRILRYLPSTPAAASLDGENTSRQDS
jgi:hypothetical protein